MLDITLLCVGKLKESYFAAACGEYGKRLGAYCRLTVTELAEARRSSDPTPGELAAALAREAEAIRAAVPKGAALIVLSPEGRLLPSEALAAALEKYAASGVSKLCFLIGGSDGIDAALKRDAALLLSMSPMTFPHHLARVMLLEQLYRAFTITRGGKYHK